MEAAIITSLGQHGEGRGTRKGKPLFIPLALPREEISYHVLKENAHYTLGSLEQILKPSEDRITPRCPYFGQCGGCHLMHLKKAAQLIEKQKLVQQAASHYPTLKQSVVMACIPSPEQDHWRAKSQLPTEIRGNKLVWGLYKVDSHEIVPITACYVHATPAEEVLGALRITLEETPLPQEVLEGKSHFRFLHLRTSLTQNACILTFITDGVSEKYLTKVAERLSTITDRLVGVFHLVNTSDNNTVIQGTPHLIYGSRFLEERLHIGEEFFDFQITPDSFFQVNPQQAEALINYAIQQIDPKPSDTLLDAYCGVGTIAIPLAKKCLKVWGIEYSQSAVTAAKDSALRYSLTNTQFIAGDAEEAIKQVVKIDIATLNPPRKGCSNAFLETLIAASPKQILYISCNPTSLMRDLDYLVTRGYQLKSMQPFDMFPETMHVETVAHLIRA